MLLYLRDLMDLYIISRLASWIESGDNTCKYLILLVLDRRRCRQFYRPKPKQPGNEAKLSLEYLLHELDISKSECSDQTTIVFSPRQSKNLVVFKRRDRPLSQSNGGAETESRCHRAPHKLLRALIMRWSPMEV